MVLPQSLPVVSHFFAYLFRLRFINRWSLMRQVFPENVAEHTFDVAVLTHALCTIGRDVYGKQVDAGRAVTLALFHDVSEVITGDIATPVKHHSEHILRGMRELETLAGERLIDMVPRDLVSEYRAAIKPEGEDAELILWVKAADKLSAYLKCLSEIAAGNREFAVARDQVQLQVEALGMPEVAYFLERFAPSFQRTLDEISR